MSDCNFYGTYFSHVSLFFAGIVIFQLTDNFFLNILAWLIMIATGGRVADNLSFGKKHIQVDSL